MPLLCHTVKPIQPILQKRHTATT